MSDDLNAAISAATTEAVKEVGGGETVVEATPAPDKVEVVEEKKEETAPVAKEPVKVEAPEEPDFKLSAADLEKINKDPELKKAYRSMVKGFTAKTTELAETRKSLEERAKVADWIQSDPDAAVETLARMRGKTFAQAKVEATDKVTSGLEAKWAETVGPEAAKLLRPLFEETAKEMFKTIVEPLRADVETQKRAAAAQGISAGVAQFGAERTEAGEEWTEEIQEAMAKRMAKVEPADDASLHDYLDILYDAEIAQRNRARGVKTQLERLRSAANSTEPTTSSRSAPKSEERITDDMDDRTAIALAVKQAQEAFAR